MRKIKLAELRCHKVIPVIQSRTNSFGVVCSGCKGKIEQMSEIPTLIFLVLWGWEAAGGGGNELLIFKKDMFLECISQGRRACSPSMLLKIIKNKKYF